MNDCDVGKINTVGMEIVQKMFRSTPTIRKLCAMAESKSRFHKTIDDFIDQLIAASMRRVPESVDSRTLYVKTKSLGFSRQLTTRLLNERIKKKGLRLAKRIKGGIVNFHV